MPENRKSLLLGEASLLLGEIELVQQDVFHPVTFKADEVVMMTALS